jgi:hypothetical protein
MTGVVSRSSAGDPGPFKIPLGNVKVTNFLGISPGALAPPTRVSAFAQFEHIRGTLAFWSLRA